jgi:hypothetical protein
MPRPAVRAPKPLSPRAVAYLRQASKETAARRRVIEDAVTSLESPGQAEDALSVVASIVAAILAGEDVEPAMLAGLDPGAVQAALAQVRRGVLNTHTDPGQHAQTPAAADPDSIARYARRGR